MAVMDGPLEPPSSTSSNVADVPDDPSFVNFFSTAMTIGSANATVGGQPYQSSVPVPPRAQGVITPTMATIQSPSPPLSTTTPLMPLLEPPEPNSDTKRAANLVKPSTFFGPPPSSFPLMVPPVSSSMLTAPPLHPPGSLQRPYGAPLLQPFPPPTPPPSLTPTAAPTLNYAPAITREKIHEALLVLVQDNEFIDMVYRVVLNAHSP